MKKLTTRQIEILDYVESHLAQNSYWPSIREIQNGFGFRSTNAVMGHLRAIEKKGYISRMPGLARSFRINISNREKSKIEKPNKHKNNVLDIPIYGSIAAGYPDGIEPSGEIGRMQIDTESLGVARANKPFALKVRGESMIDAGIYEGDLVVLESSSPRGGDVVAALIDGETTLKRYIQDDGRAPYLRAENAHYPDLHPVSELIIQGIAKAVVRSL